MKRILILCAVAAFSLWGCSQERPTETSSETDAVEAPPVLQVAAISADHGVQPSVCTYEITLENLTPATGPGSSQPFSPPVLASHNHRVRLFRRGHAASDELAQIAEDAINAPMVAKLAASDKVFDVVEGGGVILPGESATFEIQTAHSARRFSAVFMLVNTNDAFGGLDAVELPRWGEKTYHVYAFDAGSEENTELAAHIPGPCCGSPGQGNPTHEYIRYHAGIKGAGDLDPKQYGWGKKVARLTVRRIAPTYEVTLENMTPATVPGGSQVFSPPVLATHRSGFRIFRVWGYASDELAAIAEDGDTGPMNNLLAGTKKVFDVVNGDGPVLPGGSSTYEVRATPYYRRLSMAFMLVNTNDGFGGVDRLPLPRSGRVSYYLDTYDAGSEENTELATHIPGPCCGSPGEGVDEHLRIRPHPGILGTGDLAPADYGWTDPSAKLTITRTK